MWLICSVSLAVFCSEVVLLMFLYNCALFCSFLKNYCGEKTRVKQDSELSDYTFFLVALAFSPPKLFMADLDSTDILRGQPEKSRMHRKAWCLTIVYPIGSRGEPSDLLLLLSGF